MLDSQASVDESRRVRLQEAHQGLHMMPESSPDEPTCRLGNGLRTKRRFSCCFLKDHPGHGLPRFAKFGMPRTR
jgi:hypothetical protein